MVPGERGVHAGVSDPPDSAASIPERWFVLTVRSASPLASELLVDPLLSLGGHAVEDRDGELVTHLPPPDEPENFLHRARAELEEASGLDDLRLNWCWQEHEDWASLWKQGLGPRTITDRLVVTPSWCLAEANTIAGEHATVVVIDPGMAFGTAEHGTTRGALRLLDRALSPGEALLDAGCGSAILAIAAARLGAARVLAADLDQYATDAAHENVARNAVSDRVVVETAAVDPGWIAQRGPFGGILGNIQSGVLVPLLGSFAQALEEGGWVILSGILAEEWAFVADAAAESGFSLEEVDVDGEWWSGWFTLASGS